MRRLSSLILLAASGLGLASPARAQAGCAGAAGAGMARLDVIATDVRAARGQVAFTLYPDDRRRFLAKGGKLLRARIASAVPATRACFWVRPGFYAVATYHDENGDQDFNRSLIAIKEGFGFSNDAPTTFGLPAFAATRFEVRPGGAAIRIRTRYRR